MGWFIPFRAIHFSNKATYGPERPQEQPPREQLLHLAKTCKSSVQAEGLRGSGGAALRSSKPMAVAVKTKPFWGRWITHFSGDWDVRRGYRILTHGHMGSDGLQQRRTMNRFFRMRNELKFAGSHLGPKIRWEQTAFMVPNAGSRMVIDGTCQNSNYT